MLKLFCFLFTVVALSVMSGTSAAAQDKPPGGEWRSLLDEKLSAWEIWMGVPHESITGLPPGTGTSTNGRTGTPMGLNNDPKHVFTVSMESGEPVLHVTGEIWGGLTTRESFTNYHLCVDVKWGETKWPPRQNLVRNSGLLYHATGPHGAFWNTWKRCVEFEIQEKDFGDSYFLGGTRADVAVSRVGKILAYDPSGETMTLGAGIKTPGGGRAAHAAGDFEKPAGEWNTLELYTLGDTSVHVVNGHVANVLRNISFLEGKPALTNRLDGGQLQLQSESAEVFFRRVRICPITELPAAGKQKTAAAR